MMVQDPSICPSDIGARTKMEDLWSRVLVQCISMLDSVFDATTVHANLAHLNQSLAARFGCLSHWLLSVYGS